MHKANKAKIGTVGNFTIGFPKDKKEKNLKQKGYPGPESPLGLVFLCIVVIVFLLSLLVAGKGILVIAVIA